MVIIVGQEESLLFVKFNSIRLGRITSSAIINITERNRGAARSAVTHLLKLISFFSVFYVLFSVLSQRINSLLLWRSFYTFT